MCIQKHIHSIYSLKSSSGASKSSAIKNCPRIHPNVSSRDIFVTFSDGRHRVEWDAVVVYNAFNEHAESVIAPLKNALRVHSASLIPTVFPRRLTTKILVLKFEF
jgi:hypothetical protein